MYQLKKHYFYGSHGVVQLVKENGEYFVFSVKKNNMSVIIPKDKVAQFTIRELSSIDAIELFVKGLTKKVEIQKSTWNKRYRENVELLKQGYLPDTIYVINLLVGLKKTKDLSFGERKLLDHAKSMLVEEISFVKGIAESEIEQEINLTLARAA